jgi:phage terminase large subunit
MSAQLAVEQLAIEPAPFDWLNPEYKPIWDKRVHRVATLRADPFALAVAKRWYKHHPADFINDWGVTVDPRNVGTPRAVIMPFVLFPLQREFIGWLQVRWQTKDDGILVKSRDCGASWLAMGFSCWLCLFWGNATVGFGSAKEEKVDSSGDPGSLFYKGRMFMQYLPREFKGDWNLKQHSSHRRLTFPETGAAIIGQAGDNIGVGDRTTIFFVDEFAVVERPQRVDSNLIATTDCRIEMSTVKGTANTFAERAQGGLITRFDFPVEEDPRKFYKDKDDVPQPHPEFAERVRKMDPVVYAEQYGRDFAASVEGVIIPAEWVKACVGAHLKLGITPSGVKRGSFDVADQGKDLCCYASRHGILLRFIQSWRGKGSDTFASTERSFRLADSLGDEGFDFDGDGLGGPIRGDARKINEERVEAKRKTQKIGMFRGSGAVMDQEMIAEGTDRTNLDYFENYKAQSWWALRRRVNITWRAVTGVLKPGEYNPSDIISIDPELPELDRVKRELSQPIWKWSKSGKMMIDKAPDDVASPNHADAVMMLFPYARPPMIFSDELFQIL